jgi:hypothetical protein
MNAIDESLPLRNWTQSAGEEVANGISHGIGLVGGIVGTPILLLAAFHHGDVPFLIGTTLRRCLFAQSERRAVQLDKLARAAD